MGMIAFSIGPSLVIIVAYLGCLVSIEYMSVTEHATLAMCYGSSMYSLDSINSSMPSSSGNNTELPNLLSSFCVELSRSLASSS